MIKKIKKSQAPVVRRIGGERNYVDVSATTYACDTTGTVTLLNTVAQGASQSQRIGKKWLMKSIQMKGYFFAGSTGTYRGVGALLVYDKRPTGSLPAITDILVSVNSESFLNDVNSGRFRIIRRWDEQIVGNTGTPTLTDMTIKNADTYVKLNLPVVNKAAGTGAIGDIEQGALYLVTCGNNSAGTGAASLYAGFRIRFIDM